MSDRISERLEPRRQRVLASAAIPRGFLILGQEPVTIGRARDCRLVLMSDQVSRYHCCVYPEGHGHVVEDTASRNGTFVNGKKIKGARRLDHDDTITVGGFKLRFLIVEGSREELAERFDPLKSETHEDQAVSRGDVALAGKIAGSILVEACQLVELNRHTGELRMETSGVSGYLRFKDGVIVDAKLGMETGEKAARRVLSATHGEYAFKQGPPPAGALALRPSALAMDLLRREDERTRRFVKPPDGSKDPPTRPMGTPRPE
jgi:pSer/pThr/pTyr-binding forkhead associated (FHA) protein